MAEPKKSREHHEKELHEALGGVDMLAVTPQQFANITAINTALLILLAGSVEHCRVHVPTLHVALGCVDEKTSTVVVSLEKYGLATFDKAGLVTITERGMHRAIPLAVSMVETAQA